MLSPPHHLNKRKLLVHCNDYNETPLNYHFYYFAANFVNGSNANDDFTYDTTVVFGTRRFRVSKNMLNYSLAEQHCENDNSILAVIDSKELAQTIKLALENSERHKGATVLEVSLTDQSIWIGLQLNVQNRSAGKWSNGEIYDSSSS